MSSSYWNATFVGGPWAEKKMPVKPDQQIIETPAGIYILEEAEETDTGRLYVYFFYGEAK